MGVFVDVGVFVEVWVGVWVRVGDGVWVRVGDGVGQTAEPSQSKQLAKTSISFKV